MKNLTPKETFDFLKANPTAVFVDCRSEWEFLFVGHPVGAILIPWYEGENWDLNPRFLGEVRIATSHNRPVLLICRSGNRSREAGEFLEKNGFDSEAVYNVKYGFEGELDEHHHRSTLNGWRFDGLPWEQC
jgi:rhodanese-related sulfurtransferase